jgi:hypothetical protein
MESAEQQFLASEFLAPVMPGGRVRVRIAGLVCNLQVVGHHRAGWAILKPVSMVRARVVARPSLGQVRDYLALFPAVRLVLVARASSHPEAPPGVSPAVASEMPPELVEVPVEGAVEGDWLAMPAQRGDRRFEIEGPVRLHLVTGAEPFQQVVARFDGGHFWFQEVDRRRNPAIAAYLREALAGGTTVEALHKPTLTAEEREAYRLAQRALEAAARDQVEMRLADALAHAGAELASYIEREDAYAVSYTVDGQQYRSTVRKDDLTVVAAGICLEGQDRRFDLQSLVGVLREGVRSRRLYRVQ